MEILMLIHQSLGAATLNTNSPHLLTVEDAFWVITPTTCQFIRGLSLQRLTE